MFPRYCMLRWRWCCCTRQTIEAAEWKNVQSEAGWELRPPPRFADIAMTPSHVCRNSPGRQARSSRLHFISPLLDLVAFSKTKMVFSRIALLLALTHIAACEQPSAPSPIAAPLRELPWAKGGLNFLHTTDTHGWHGGHLQEAQYAADWGDYISFAHHLRKKADEDGSDILLIDTGDRVEGNGLYDASDPKGKFTFDIFKHQSIDVVTSGNHELYLKNTSKREYDEMVPDYKNSYIASNLDIRDPKDKNDKGEWTAMAPRYRILTTKNLKLRVLAFGFLFDFHGNAPNTRVQDVEETIKEQWFQDAIREKNIDLFLIAGHVPVRASKEYDAVYNAIRKVKWDAPIVFFGGHTHIRDFKK